MGLIIAIKGYKNNARNLGRIAHMGFIHSWGSRLVETVEGNTNDQGSREGTRVALKRRPTRTIYKVSRYIN